MKSSPSALKSGFASVAFAPIFAVPVFAVPVFAALAGVALIGCGDRSASIRQALPESSHATRDEGSGTAPPSFSVNVRQPSGPPRIDLGQIDARGRPVTAACSTCHGQRPADPSNRTAADLIEFHSGLVFNHGSLSCLTCHHPDDYDVLRAADGAAIEYTDVMTLCAQCHSGQADDYVHGAHGGMTGFWDLSRGPRNRLNCIDCHDPHAPQFPPMYPTFKPIDRFLSASDEPHE